MRIRIITLHEEAKVAEARATARWLRNAIGRLEDPRTERTSANAAEFDTTWNLASRDGCFTGYAQLSMSMEGAGSVTVLVRDTSSSPPMDDVVMTEPFARDGTVAIDGPGDHRELRRTVNRWIAYLDDVTVANPDLLRLRSEDVMRVGLLKAMRFSDDVDVCRVSPPTAHHRIRINDREGALDDLPDVERAIDSRWADVIQIGHARTSASSRWSVVAPAGEFVQGKLDPMERLRLHRAILEGPPEL